MYRSNRRFNIPPPPSRAYPRHLTPLPSQGGGNLIIRVFQGVGNLIPMHYRWGIWTAPSISCQISGVASYHGGRGVRGFSWKRLCLCGQLVTIGCNGGQLLWPAACILINKVSDDECQWICHDVVISIGGDFFYVERFVFYITHKAKLSIQSPCSTNFHGFARDFCS